MKENIFLSENWELKKINPIMEIDTEKFLQNEPDWLAIDCMPAQVQDVLLKHRLLPEEMLAGWCKETTWIADYDWVYRCRFSMENRSNARLILQGLDTYADVYLNGKLLLQHNNFYLPDSAEITDILNSENILLLHFHRVKDYLTRLPLEEQWKDAMPHCKMIRKPVHDFLSDNVEWGSNYQGAVPGFTPVGVYRDIYVQCYEETEITDSNVTAIADDNYDGIVKMNFKGKGAAHCIKMEYKLYDEDENETLTGCISPESNDKYIWRVQECIEVKGPKLWQPSGFGKPYLYRLTIKIYDKGILVDEWDKKIGFKNIKMPGMLEFIINGNRVRLWGGSLDPLQGYTHCWVEERAVRLFDMIENAHFNILRIWGEGIPLPEEFYDMADQRGIMIWQEFFLGHGAVPDSQHYCNEYKKEAKYLLKRLRHRASLLMWCGGNETVMGAEFYGHPSYGKNILTEEFPRLVEQLDPDRYYHPNSPWGGEWANDPRTGDYHTYDCVWEYPYRDYPNFISEHIRTSPPVMHSLKRMIKGEIWEESYQGKLEYVDNFSLPQNWIERSNLSAMGQRKTGAFWEYYDAGNAEDMIYRFGASYGQEIRRYGEQIRRGSRKPTDGGHRSKGYLTCKLVDTWPKIYCATIDFFQEGYIPYYSVGRLFTPVMLSFQKEESIRLWVVNDSAEVVKGKVTVGIYHLGTEEFQQSDELEIVIGQGETDMIFDLEKYRFFSKDCILYAELKNEEGKSLYTNIDYVDVERHLRFKDAKLSVEIEENELIIESDRFVRCVEIKGKTGEDEFGWLFSDNYFDLMPHGRKRIKILGNKEQGRILVRGHYLKTLEAVDFVRK